MIYSLPAYLLRRHIADSSHHGSRSGRRRAGHGGALARRTHASRLLRQSEIQDLYTAVFRDENVVWFEITMHDPFLVRRCQTLRYLDSIVNRLAQREWASAQSLTQTFSFQQFRNQIVGAVLHADIIDGKK